MVLRLLLLEAQVVCIVKLVNEAMVILQKKHHLPDPTTPVNNSTHLNEIHERLFHLVCGETHRFVDFARTCGVGGGGGTVHSFISRLRELLWRH